MSEIRLVTLGTDGCRDYVQFHDGRQVTLGSVSALKLVTSVVHGVNECRRVLNSFLSDGEATFTADILKIKEMLKKPRSRWANNDSIDDAYRGTSMSRLASLDTWVSALERECAKFQKHAASEGPSSVAAIRVLNTMGHIASRVPVIASEDDDMKKELKVLMSNDPKLLKLKETALSKVLKKKDSVAADWMPLVDKAVSLYAVDADEDTKKKLESKPFKNSLAADVAKEENKKISDGEYTKTASVSGDAEEVADELDLDNAYEDEDLSDNDTFYGMGKESCAEVMQEVTSAKPYAGKDLSDNDTFYGLSKEAQVHEVVRKVASTFQVIEASEKSDRSKFLAKRDLLLVNKRLASLLNGNGSKVASGESFAGLAKMADKISKFFQ